MTRAMKRLVIVTTVGRLSAEPVSSDSSPAYEVKLDGVFVATVYKCTEGKFNVMSEPLDILSTGHFTLTRCMNIVALKLENVNKLAERIKSIKRH